MRRIVDGVIAEDRTVGPNGAPGYVGFEPSEDVVDVSCSRGSSRGVIRAVHGGR